MAQTTTSYSSCNVQISLDTDAGALVDISGSTNAVNLDFGINRGEANTFDGDYPISKVCGKSCTGSLTIVYSTTADESWDLIKGWYHVYDGAARTLRIDIPQTGAGLDRVEGEFILESYSLPLSSTEAGPIVIECAIFGDGTINMLEIGT